ncbi:MAG: fatty acid desaturase [Verrucomicrobiota bacterium]
MSRSEKNPAWLKQAISLGADFKIDRSRLFIHNARNLISLTLLLLTIGSLLCLGVWLNPWLHILVASPFLGMAFMGLLFLVLHEGSHSMYLVSKDRKRTKKLNWLFGSAIGALAGINYPHHWEKGHLVHHARPMEDDDPQSHNCTTGSELVKRIVPAVLIPGWSMGTRVFSKVNRDRGSSSKPALIGFGVIWGTIMALGWQWIGWSGLIAWMLGFGWLTALNELKGGLEHGGAMAEEDHYLFRSRSTVFPFVSVVFPFNLTYHFEHHLRPDVPWYRLPEYSRAIHAVMPAEASAAFMNRDPIAMLRNEIAAPHQHLATQK